MKYVNHGELSKKEIIVQVKFISVLTAEEFGALLLI
jgi:hypothetical protein